MKRCDCIVIRLAGHAISLFHLLPLFRTCCTALHWEIKIQLSLLFRVVNVHYEWQHKPIKCERNAIARVPLCLCECLSVSV